MLAALVLVAIFGITAMALDATKRSAAIGYQANRAQLADTAGATTNTSTATEQLECSPGYDYKVNIPAKASSTHANTTQGSQSGTQPPKAPPPPIEKVAVCPGTVAAAVDASPAGGCTDYQKNHGCESTYFTGFFNAGWRCVAGSKYKSQEIYVSPNGTALPPQTCISGTKPMDNLKAALKSGVAIDPTTASVFAVDTALYSSLPQEQTTGLSDAFTEAQKQTGENIAATQQQVADNNADIKTLTTLTSDPMCSGTDSSTLSTCGDALGKIRTLTAQNTLLQQHLADSNDNLVTLATAQDALNPAANQPSGALSDDLPSNRRIYLTGGDLCLVSTDPNCKTPVAEVPPPADTSAPPMPDKPKDDALPKSDPKKDDSATKNDQPDTRTPTDAGNQKTQNQSTFQPSPQPQQQTQQQVTCPQQYMCNGNAIYTYYSNGQSCQRQLYQQCPTNYTCQQGGMTCVPSQTQCQSSAQTIPSPSSCSVGSWQGVDSSGNIVYKNGVYVSQNACISSWQCVPAANTNTNTAVAQPTAQISGCPKVVAVNQQFSIGFLCTSATQSQGSGFDTGNQQSGTAQTTVSQPASGNSITYGLACTNAQNQTASAQCVVSVVRPWANFVSVPGQPQSGAIVHLGWVTGGMNSCIISNGDFPDFTAQNANNTSTGGTATSPPITRETTFKLTCDSAGRQTKVYVLKVTPQ